MTIRSYLARQFQRSVPVPVVPAAFASQPLTSPPFRITEGVLEALRTGGKPAYPSPFTGLPTPPPGVRPADHPAPKGMAMDEADGTPGGQWGEWAQGGMWGEGLHFPGYPYLAELAQRPEYRHIAETVAEEMTRKWVKLLSTGKDDKTDKVHAIEDAMKLYGLRDAFNRAMEFDGFFGMGVIYIDTGDTDNPDELKMPLLMDPGKIAKGKLRAFIPLDPTWVSPSFYNSTDPLKPDFFKPSVWYVMGKQVHASRLLIVRSREVPDILKASYNFGGLSLSQMAKPYVDNWIRTRQSVSDLLHSFTVFVLKTTMGSYLSDAAELVKRLKAFVLGRDNQGLMLIDKESEELDNVSVPLGTLDHLQTQAQEQMASVSQIPLIKLLGIMPSGLNASSDGEIRVWYDRVKAKQEKVFGANLTTAIQVIQLSETGAIDPEITFEFVSLWELDAAGRAAVEKMKADTDAVYMADAVVSNEEVRTRLAGDPDSPYHGLEGPAPELPEPAAPDDSDDDADKIGKGGAEGSMSGANSGDAAMDEWEEGKHPRAANGQFGTGSGFNAERGELGGAELTTSQHYLDDDTIDEKIAAGDFDVFVSPEFEAEEKKLRAILDGHHSLAAAVKSGNIPNFIEHSVRENDNLQLLEEGDVEGFLQAIHMGEGDYRNPVTERDTF